MGQFASASNEMVEALREDLARTRAERHRHRMLLLIDLALLVLDLGDPLRFHHMLRVFKPSSPMSLGTWSLTIYSLPLTVIVATELLPGEWGWLAPPRCDWNQATRRSA